jgi:hypothetical protein
MLEETGSPLPENAPAAEGHKADAPAVPAAAPKSVLPAKPATAPAATATANSTPRPILPLQDLMYGLIYPGVLGTGLVLSGQRATKEASVVAALTDPALWVAAAAGLFFAVSFASVFEEPQKEDATEEWYGWTPFLIDLVEVVLMFACFYFLGLFEVPNVPPPELHWAYGLLIVEIWWQCLWRWSIGLKPFRLWGMKVGVTAVLVLGWIYGPQYPWSNILFSLGVAVFVIIYVFKDPRYRKSARIAA